MQDGAKNGFNTVWTELAQLDALAKSVQNESKTMFIKQANEHTVAKNSINGKFNQLETEIGAKKNGYVNTGDSSTGRDGNQINGQYGNQLNEKYKPITE